MGVAYPKAAYVGGLEDVNEWVSKALSEMFEAKQVSGVLANSEFTASEPPEVKAVGEVTPILTPSRLT